MICLKLIYYSLNKRFNLLHKRFISALYVTGDRAKENYAVLQPYMNFSEVFNNPELIKENIKIRKLNLDFDEVQKKYKNYCKFLNKKKNLKNMRENVVDQLRAVETVDNVERQQKIINLKEEGRKIRNELKLLKENLYSIEDDFVKDFLNFPNKLHDTCPIDYIKILYREGLPDETLSQSAKCHLSKENLITFKDSTCYYLLNEAAVFDLEFSLNCTDFIVKKGYTQMANPDFSRRIILEALYSDNINEYEQIKEHDEKNSLKVNTLHLNGGGSFTSFLGFIAKLTTPSSVFPLKLVSLGRQYYSKKNDNDQEKGLFTAMQSNAIQIFIATKDERSADDEMDEILNLAVDIYKKLGIHFQIIYEKANEILPSEALRASIQMFSPYFKEYVEVGHISNYSDYLSKRLLFNFKEGKQFKFPCIIGGPIIDVSKVLGCLMEHDINIKSQFFKPTKSAVENFKSLFEV